jgi:Ca2+-binding RTX toxin-like protein
MFDILECRTFLSATVTETYNGYYEVVGTDAADAISLAVDVAENRFTLDGTTYENVSGVGVYGLGGDDQITIAGDGSFGFLTAAAHGGDGNDALSLNFDGGLWGDGGNDALALSNAFCGEAYGGAGDDAVNVAGETTYAQIDGGDGDDTIDASANNYAVVACGGAGSDIVHGSAYDDQLCGGGGTDALYGNAGNDVLYVSAGTVDGGDGADTACVTVLGADGLVSVEFVYPG